MARLAGDDRTARPADPRHNDLSTGGRPDGGRDSSAITEHVRRRVAGRGFAPDGLPCAQRLRGHPTGHSGSGARRDLRPRLPSQSRCAHTGDQPLARDWSSRSCRHRLRSHQHGAGHRGRRAGRWLPPACDNHRRRSRLDPLRVGFPARSIDRGAGGDRAAGPDPRGTSPVGYHAADRHTSVGAVRTGHLDFGGPIFGRAAGDGASARAGSPADPARGRTPRVLRGRGATAHVRASSGVGRSVGAAGRRGRLDGRVGLSCGRQHRAANNSGLLSQRPDGARPDPRLVRPWTPGARRHQRRRLRRCTRGAVLPARADDSAPGLRANRSSRRRVADPSD